MWNMKRVDTVCSVCTSGVSVVCMSSMGAVLAAAGAAGGAGATSMAGMAAQAGQASAFLILPRFFDRIGLDVLNNVPNGVAQPLLVALLTITLVASYIAYLGHRRLYTPALTLASSVAMYVSIYVWMSEPLYFVSLAGLLAAGVWGLFLARAPRGQSGVLHGEKA